MSPRDHRRKIADSARQRAPRRRPAAALALSTALAIAPPVVHAQTAPPAPAVIHACYVPLTGTLYRIDETGLRQGCTSPSHVEFSWTDGGGAVRATDPVTGDLGGTFAAPTVVGLQGHAVSGATPATGQVLTFDGVKWGPAAIPSTETFTSANVAGSFVATGTSGSGSIPATGAGVRMMWYPAKGAFRAGGVVDGVWDDAKFGTNSVATGLETKASGSYSTAMGAASYADGKWSTAMGVLASTNGQTGSFVYSDASNTGFGVSAMAPNQFVVRAQHMWFGTDNSVIATTGRFLETSTGAFLSSGGVWTNVSDVSKKRAFAPVSGEDVLAHLAATPIQTWSYKTEDPSVRHMGPTAQDFYAAFHLGSSNTSIGTIDADGVSLAAIKALEQRTRDLASENAKLRSENERLSARLDAIEAALTTLGAAPRVP